MARLWAIVVRLANLRPRFTASTRTIVVRLAQLWAKLMRLRRYAVRRPVLLLLRRGAALLLLVMLLLLLLMLLLLLLLMLHLAASHGRRRCLELLGRQLVAVRVELAGAHDCHAVVCALQAEFAHFVQHIDAAHRRANYKLRAIKRRDRRKRHAKVHRARSHREQVRRVVRHVGPLVKDRVDRRARVAAVRRKLRE